MALAYSAGLLLLLQLKLGTWPTRNLGPCRTHALTNYVLQTMVAASLFFGFGLGIYGKLGTSQAVLAAAAIFTLQIALSRFGWSISIWAAGMVVANGNLLASIAFTDCNRGFRIVQINRLENHFSRTPF